MTVIRKDKRIIKKEKSLNFLKKIEEFNGTIILENGKMIRIDDIIDIEHYLKIRICVYFLYFHLLHHYASHSALLLPSLPLLEA